MDDTKLWATLYKREKIAMQALFPCESNEALTTGLQAACKQFDIAVPIVLQKHERELLQFSRTCFSPKDFIEPFSYSMFCIELFSEEKKAST